VGDTLVAVGGAFLAAGVLARLGRRIGLPTIPFFMAAGVIFGPNTPGIALVEHPEDLELLAALGLIMLLFHLGLSSPSGTSSPEAGGCSASAPSTSCSTWVAASPSAPPSTSGTGSTMG
jgi:hypothetical protein